MTFKRDNDKNKKLYYQLFVVTEIVILLGVYYFNIHWMILFFITPIILIDAWSNIRCANRQKKYITELEINAQGLTCKLANGKTENIPVEKCLFSIREVKFEKDRTEIEIRQKRLLKSKLIGRLHIINWGKVFEIRDELIKNDITQIKYRPEGYWSKYGTLTADIAITGTALTIGEVAEMVGDIDTASDARDLIMPIQGIKDDVNSTNNKT